MDGRGDEQRLNAPDVDAPARDISQRRYRNAAGPVSRGGIHFQSKRLVRTVNPLISRFWPFAQYRDVNRGSLLERAAAMRHNIALARELPVYINRWAMLSAVLLILTQGSPGPLAGLLGVLFTISFTTTVHFVNVWIRFRRAP